MSYGFVYMLCNIYMPDLVKIGCTERSPHLRAEELSKGTGIPAPFDVVCYIEVTDHQAVERRMHEWLKAHRVSENREFFEHENRDFLVALFYFQRRYHSDVLSFTDVHVNKFIDFFPSTLIDPWEKKAPPPPDLTVIDGGKESAA